MGYGGLKGLSRYESYEPTQSLGQVPTSLPGKPKPPKPVSPISGVFQITVVGNDGKPLANAEGGPLSISAQIDFKSGLPPVAVDIGANPVSYQLDSKSLGAVEVTVTKVPEGYLIPGPFKVALKPNQLNALNIVVQKSQPIATAVVTSTVAAAVLATAVGVL